MDWTIEEVLDHIQAYGHDSETINVIYVIDDESKLLDDIKLKDFLFVPRQFKVHNIADNKFVALSVNDRDEVAINAFKQHNRIALPVIDEAVTGGLSLVGVVLWGTLSGATLPLILRRAGIDPATSSAPFVATIVDVTGVIIYFLIAITTLRGTLL